MENWVDKLEYFEESDKKLELAFDRKMKFKVGSKLNFCWKSIFYCKLETKEIIETEFHKKIYFYTSSIYPIKINYKVIYNLYWNSVDETTVVINELICDKNNKMFKNDQEENNKERFIMFKKIEDILKNDLDSLYQEERIILDINIIKVWKIITDWKIFKNYIPDIYHEIIYYGNPLEIGTEFKIIHKERKDCFTKFRLVECNYCKDDVNLNISVNDENIDKKFYIINDNNTNSNNLKVDYSDKLNDNSDYLNTNKLTLDIDKNSNSDKSKIY